MTKLEFMKELESLLSDIQIEEREEALSYYNGYFEDAGENHEEEIMKELISPEHVAAIIKADLNTSAADFENRGYFTENGYQDTVNQDNRYEIIGANRKNTGNNQGNPSGAAGNSSGYDQAGRAHNTDNNGSQGTNTYGSSQTAGQNTRQDKKSNIALIVIVALVTFPVWFPFVMSVLGILIGIICAVFGVIIGFGAAGIAMIVCGIALFITGIVQLSIPFMGLVFCGAGLLVLGLGMLFMQFCILLCKNVLPAMIRGFVNLYRLPFKNRSVTA